MGRPRIINPKGEVRHLTARVPAPVVEKLEREAMKRGVTLGQVVRERLAS